MKRFSNYLAAERHLLRNALIFNDFKTEKTLELIGCGFILTNPIDNKNNRSDYQYADLFFEWLMSGSTDLSNGLIKKNPMVVKFVDKTGLPKTFSSSYGAKIAQQLPLIINELKRDMDSRRCYINILFNEDKILLPLDSTHEFPCTIGIHFMIRNGKLIMMVQMRSNNLWSVMPYDVYNFTSLQCVIAYRIGIPMGEYYHQINSGHLFKTDIDKATNEIILAGNQELA
jgi:thymidylate synthase